jgi:hypothetical protein
MRSLTWAGLAVLLLAPVASSDEPKARSAASAETSKSGDSARRPDPALFRRYAQIRAEFEARMTAVRQAFRGERPSEKQQAAGPRPRDLFADYSRRMVDLAESSPDDPATREALLWVINQPGRHDTGEYGDQFARAAARPPSRR